AELRNRINGLWLDVEWNWHTRGNSNVLYWHWSPNNDWSMNHEVRGWNECLIAYVLAAASPRYPISADVYHRGWAQGRDFKNGRAFYGTELPLGPDYGGPLFFAHYSFLGLDPRGLKDGFADYWEQNVRHVLINREHCIRNPRGFKGYGADCWGLTASDNYEGYNAHAPDNDLGVIAPTAALSSFPYTPDHSMQALRHFYHRLGDRIWGDYGFKDSFSESNDWYAESYLAIDQGPIIGMIENHRSGLLWRLFMSCREVRDGLRKLGFESPHLLEEV
ncbi:MAG: glucoamylase family protein, partial [Dongiaceae bacterium]